TPVLLFALGVALLTGWLFGLAPAVRTAQPDLHDDLKGIVAGIIATLGGSRLLQTFLYEMSATDLTTYVGVVLLLGIAALVASYIPARRAMQVDPIVALRTE